MAGFGFPKPYPRMEPPVHREREMKVLALGMSRTGTMSLYTALNKLGYNCYHMAECSLDAANDSLLLWRQAIEAKYHGKGRMFEGKDFDQMLWRYDAVTDIPSILFVDELLAAYPHAKIILTNRLADSWVRSIERSFYAVLSWKRWGLLQLLDRKFTRNYIPVVRSGLEVWTEGNWQDKSRLTDGYNAHYSHVRSAANAQGREILEFRVQEGWEPLCKFLGNEVPDEPFPRVNEGDFVVRLHYLIFWVNFLRAILDRLKLVAPVVVVITAWWWYRQGGVSSK